MLWHLSKIFSFCWTAEIKYRQFWNTSFITAQYRILTLDTILFKFHAPSILPEEFTETCHCGLLCYFVLAVVSIRTLHVITFVLPCAPDILRTKNVCLLALWSLKFIGIQLLRHINTYSLHYKDQPVVLYREKVFGLGFIKAENALCRKVLSFNASAGDVCGYSCSLKGRDIFPQSGIRVILTIAYAVP